MLVVTPPDGASEESSYDVVIRDTIHEVLEVVPTLPRLQRLSGMLRGREYDEGHEDDDDVDMEDDEGRLVSALCCICEIVLNCGQSKKRRLTYEEAWDMLQASDLELSRGLKSRRILLLNGMHLPIVLREPRLNFAFAQASSVQ